MRPKKLSSLLLLLVAVAFSGAAKSRLPMSLSSPVFKHGGWIPTQYTCEGGNISPPLEWKNLPPGTQSLVIIAEDPDAPKQSWVHWVIYNLPPTISDVPEALPPIKKLANAEMQGTNDFKKIGYGGPCPPSGAHRYFFTLYALNEVLQLELGATKAEVVGAMQGHILAEAKLMGRYQKRRP